MTGEHGRGRPSESSRAGHVVADQSEAIAFLADPAHHGPETTKVERIDTHGAMVFLAGGRAYKIKRAVRYPYMDFSSLALRRAACAREVALNRRTAPDLYLGCEAITRRADGTLALGGAGTPVEWVVVMRRFDQVGLGDRLAQAGKLTPTMMTRLAEAVADLHESAERLEPESAAGGGSRGLAAVIAENDEEIAERPDLFPNPAAQDFATAAQEALSRVSGLLDRRLAEGYVRRCHGDLHLRNVFFEGSRPTIFDAIEFNDAIACIDVLYDLAFLLMDLEHRDLRPFANLILNRYLQCRDDLAGLAALPLFLATRAAVRAKVSVSMADSQTDADKTERLQSEAVGYFREARDYLDPARPQLVAIGGLSGTGKSSVARALAPKLGAAPGAIHLRSDVLRKALAGVDELERLPPESYTPARSREVYKALSDRAATALDAGRAVVVDAVYARPEERSAIAALATARNLPFTGLWLEAAPGVLKARVADRRGDASDATAAVVEKQLAYDLGEIDWQRLSAAGPLEVVVARAERLLAT